MLWLAETPILADSSSAMPRSRKNSGPPEISKGALGSLAMAVPSRTWCLPSSGPAAPLPAGEEEGTDPSVPDWIWGFEAPASPSTSFTFRTAASSGIACPLSCSP